ncbi:hypothetical protein [Aureimonas sp. ME7]|uniref:hypothetical protein n=1 Tax=Aureimonas sp. ME7 TaxID=2744252 RepID=UPI0015FB8819|nr:hypothetical protein [Aureimonas sp. ME7]
MTDTRYRLGGLVCLAIAAGAFWLGIWSPLQDAQIGVETVLWVPRISVLVALCAVFGVFFLATGGRYPYRDVERQTLTPVGWALFAVVAVAAFAGFFATDVMLRSLGYS